ncbi:NADP-dependent oxidoreductase [Corynebacterium phoceense]|uniref:NADP-dependent oxidoreductase n=1 Tax=Corynebacterium phoceense TaxID=1686286 RepID=UPI00211CB772|nr:NADP-dependent oxidoreductase [Corynebacterium phoceense]MCQ9334486.1 NADP-dependent oxidoreductase [Corynebacterium phoceense]MCQ9337390.1 NADP-dependent oxidoreductase [Corynebacterium phoceense]
MSKVYVFTEYGGPENQELTDREVPQPGPGELGVRVHAAGVNPLDWKLRSGAAGRSRTLPAALGEEAAGTVTAVGEGVEGFTVGDEVLGLVAPGAGGYAEDTLLAAESTVPKPEEISFIDGAAIPIAGSTAYAGTHQVELEPGQSLLINGAGGGVGLMAAQIGRVHKFQVIGVGSEDKRGLIKSTGATFVASGQGLADRVHQVLPDGVDLVFDLVGGQALRSAAPLAKDPSLVVSAADAGTVEELGGQVLRRTPEMIGKITGVIQYGLVDPTVLTTYPLKQAGDAVAQVEEGHTRGKVVLEIIADQG